MTRLRAAVRRVAIRAALLATLLVGIGIGASAHDADGPTAALPSCVVAPR